jgi:hypothetical protein
MGMLSVDAGMRRIDRAERAFLAGLEDSGVAPVVLAEADLGPSGAPQPAFFIDVRMLSYQEHFDGPDGRYWVGVIFGSLTAGLGWLVAIDSHANSTHTFEYEVRVYDVRGAPVVRALDSEGTFVNRYDTSVAAPLMRRTYSGELHTWIGSGTNGPGGADLERFMDEQGDELAAQMLDACGEDIAAAIRRGSDTPAPVATSGGEAPVVETAPPSAF